MKKFLLGIWDALHVIKDRITALYFIIVDFFYRHMHKQPKVAGVKETVDCIVKNRNSIARFGDGEIKLIAGKDLLFQKSEPNISKKLGEVLSSDMDGLMIAIADMFDVEGTFNEKTNKHWKKHLTRYRRTWYNHLIKGKKYYNASMTRQYIGLREKSKSGDVFDSIKRIWDGRDIVFIEGEKSKMGVGNDLFDNAKSIRRIIGPSTQAFTKYDELITEAKKVEKTALILLALGPCATALAYDLHKLGYQAVDIGHVDIEYEWYLAGVTEKTPVNGKLVMEAVSSESYNQDIEDETYQKQIIAKVI